MSAQLSKENRRNLIKAVGVDVVDAIERCTLTVTTLNTQHQTLLVQHAALARELADLQRKQAVDVQALNERADALGAWCEKNEHEGRGASSDWAVARVADLHFATAEYRIRRVFWTMSHWERLLFMLFGRMPVAPKLKVDGDLGDLPAYIPRPAVQSGDQ